MTQEERAALVEELRLNDSEIYLPLLGKAADQIEADAQRIAELEAQVERYWGVIQGAVLGDKAREVLASHDITA